jgi:hypothetical protein
MLYKTIRTYGGGYRIRLFGHGLLVVLTERVNDFRGSSPAFIMYGCETWSHTLREENRLRVFENRMLRRKFISKREEVAGGWRRLHNEDLHNMCASTNIIRMNKIKEGEMDETCSMHEKCFKNVWKI